MCAFLNVSWHETDTIKIRVSTKGKHAHECPEYQRFYSEISFLLWVYMVYDNAEE